MYIKKVLWCGAIFLWSIFLQFSFFKWRFLQFVGSIFGCRCYRSGFHSARDVHFITKLFITSNNSNWNSRKQSLQFSFSSENELCRKWLHLDITFKLWNLLLSIRLRQQKYIYMCPTVETVSTQRCHSDMTDYFKTNPTVQANK